MTETKRHRIKFYSKEDGSVGYHLLKAEELLNSYQQQNAFALCDLIEYYNIKLHFDNKLFLPNWNEEVKDKYTKTTESIFKILKGKILLINDNTLEAELNDLDYNYCDDYWNLLTDLNIYKSISEMTIAEVLKNDEIQIYNIITQKKLVEKFDKVIKAFLMDYEKTAEIILSNLEEKDAHRNKESKYFPKSLSIADNEAIINKYLDTEEPNLNYVRLIENSTDSNEFRLNSKTRLKAKKKSKELNEKILQRGTSVEFGISVSFNKDQIEPVKYNSDNTNLEVSYSESFIDEHTDNIDLFRLFKYPFFYTDNKNLIELVSKQSELDVFERIVIKSKNEYEIGLRFYRKEYLSNIQLFIYDDYLRRKGNNIESVINSFVDFLNEKIRPHKLLFRIDVAEKSYLERIRIVAPDLEFLLKQFKTFVDEKCIDIELLQINSTPIRLSEISSLKKIKYLYSNDNTILRLKYLFFSDQSSLYYVKHFENRHRNLYDLLINENVKFEYFENYQKEIIESLIKDDYLKIINREYVIINKTVLIYLIGEIHKDEVISYWNYPKAIRNEIDELIDKNLVIAENTLFTKQERSYLNYYLNKKEFTNGFDLRNKYLHGTNSLSENEQKPDYFRLLKIIILTLLKIEDDITEIEK